MGNSIAYNKVVLIGRPTKDPVYDSDYKRSKFSLAVSRNDKNNNTDFIPIVAWDKLSNVVKEHVTTGKLILVEGELHIDKYQSKTGENKYFTSIKMTKMKFLESKKHYNKPDDLEEHTSNYDEESIRKATELVLKKLSKNKSKNVKNSDDIFEDMITSNDNEVEYSDDDEVPF
jgi:single-strand DNA-binding protein